MDNNPETLAPLGTQRNRTQSNNTEQITTLRNTTQNTKKTSNVTLPKNSDTVLLPFLLYINNLSK
jgi:hypothetical protein